MNLKSGWDKQDFGWDNKHPYMSRDTFKIVKIIGPYMYKNLNKISNKFYFIVQN